MVVAVIVVAVLWVNGITNMHKNHPDYKGNELFGGFDFDDEDEVDNENQKDYDED
jgi:hypothetical protein